MLYCKVGCRYWEYFIIMSDRIAYNLEIIRDRIAAAAIRAGRAPDAVSYTHLTLPTKRIV